MFKEIYHAQRGVESFYGVIKERLNARKLFGKNGTICKTRDRSNPFFNWFGIDIDRAC